MALQQAVGSISFLFSFAEYPEACLGDVLPSQPKRLLRRSRQGERKLSIALAKEGCWLRRIPRFVAIALKRRRLLIPCSLLQGASLFVQQDGAAASYMRSIDYFKAVIFGNRNKYLEIPL